MDEEHAQPYIEPRKDSAQTEVGKGGKLDRQTVMQIIFLILLIVAIAALIAAVGTVYKYKNMLANPMGYNMDQFGLKYCTCYNANQEIVPIKSTNYSSDFDKFIPRPSYQTSQNNLGQLNFTGSG